MIYLDANASVPPLPEARAALADAAAVVGNPSSPHGMGRRARALLDTARDHVASALGADARDVVLTSGASEGNRWLVDAVTRRGAVLLAQGATGPTLRVVSSALEHPSVQKPLSLLRPDILGEPMDDESLAAADVVFCSAAHNESGILPDLNDVLARVTAGCLVCVDAAQAVARLPPLPARVDAIVASAHKVGGFSGAGALVLRGNARALVPPWLGGGQEGGMRPGTEAVALHAAFGAACAVVARSRAQHDALAGLRDRIEAALVSAWGARVLGGDHPRLANTTALVVSGVDGDFLRIAIDGAGVCVGFGAACSALVPEPSPSLLALGVSPADARSTVRISLSPANTAQDVEDAIARLVALSPLVARSRARRREHPDI